MKKLLPLAVVLALCATGGAVALTHSVHSADAGRAMQAAGHAPQPASRSGTYLVPGCQHHKPLCDLLAY